MHCPYCRQSDIHIGVVLYLSHPPSAGKQKTIRSSALLSMTKKEHPEGRLARDPDGAISGWL